MFFNQISHGEHHVPSLDITKDTSVITTEVWALTIMKRLDPTLGDLDINHIEIPRIHLPTFEKIYSFITSQAFLDQNIEELEELPEALVSLLFKKHYLAPHACLITGLASTLPDPYISILRATPSSLKIPSRLTLPETISEEQARALIYFNDMQYEALLFIIRKLQEGDERLADPDNYVQFATAAILAADPQVPDLDGTTDTSVFSSQILRNLKLTIVLDRLLNAKEYPYITDYPRVCPLYHRLRFPVDIHLAASMYSYYQRKIKSDLKKSLTEKLGQELSTSDDINKDNAPFACIASRLFNVLVPEQLNIIEKTFDGKRCFTKLIPIEAKNDKVPSQTVAIEFTNELNTIVIPAFCAVTKYMDPVILIPENQATLDYLRDSYGLPKPSPLKPLGPYLEYLRSSSGYRLLQTMRVTLGDTPMETWDVYNMETVDISTFFTDGGSIKKTESNLFTAIYFKASTSYTGVHVYKYLVSNYFGTTN